MVPKGVTHRRRGAVRPAAPKPKPKRAQGSSNGHGFDRLFRTNALLQVHARFPHSTWPWGQRHCGNCGSRAHVVPGEVYRAEDAVLFARIEAAFNSVDLPLTETFRIVTELGNVLERTRAPYALLLRLLRPVPGLRFLQPTHPGEQEQLVRGMGMLLAIAAARVQQGVEMPE